jgi:hypothetical protein
MLKKNYFSIFQKKKKIKLKIILLSFKKTSIIIKIKKF